MSKPDAWKVAASYWGKLESVPQSLRDEAESLYTQSTLDAAVAAAVAVERERCARWCDNRAAYYRGDDDGPDGREYKDSPPDEREGVESRRSMGAKACASVIRWNSGEAPTLPAAPQPAPDKG